MILMSSSSVLALALLSGPQQFVGEPAVPPVLTGWSLQHLTIPADLPNEFTFTVVMGEREETIRLYRHSLRSDSFMVLVDQGDGILTEVDPPEPRTYRGIVISDPESVVAASLLEDGLSGTVIMADDSTWSIEPVTRLSAEPTNDPRYAIYSGGQIVPTGHGCGFDMRLHGHAFAGAGDAGDGDGGAGGGEGEGGIAGGNPNRAEIAFDTDFEFFQKNGSSVNNTINDIELVMNSVDAVYDRDVDISYEYTGMIIRSSSSDPYSSSSIGGRLCEFRNTWNSAPESSIQRDMAHMFSGFNYGGGAIGVAWLGVVCNVNGFDCGSNANLAYGIVESRYLASTPLYLRVSLSAHEMGHNWAATHCDAQGAANCHIMCSTNNGCGGVSGVNLKFDPFSISEMNAYKGSVTCDPVLASPVAPPFFDSFPTTQLNTTNWIWNKGGVLSSAGVNEPSPSFSLNLDSAGPNEYQDDEIRSNKILLGGSTNARASYWTQHRGVETGKFLYIDYFSSAAKWVNLNTIASSGVNQDTYVFWQHTLPANARHNSFRIRFRTDGADGTDDWYIDDVRVELFTPCPADLNGDGQVNGGDLGTLLGQWGICAGCSADFNGDGKVDGADLGSLLGAWGPCS